MHKSLKRLLLGCALAVGSLSAATAAGVPVTTVDPGLNPLAVDGQIKVVFAFSDAGNDDWILDLPSLAANPIIDNHSTPIGTVVDLGNYTGNLEFDLKDMFTGRTYKSNALDAFGDFHVKTDADYGNLGVGAIPGVVQTQLNLLANDGYSITFFAWEDHDLHTYIASDWDYNDVVYAFAYKQNTQTLVPEPLTLSFIGAGLLGLGALRRRRKTK